MNRGGQALAVGEAQRASGAAGPGPGPLRRKLKSLGRFGLHIRERIGRWTDALLVFIAAVALAIGLLFPYRGVIISVIGIAFAIVIVVASAMLSAQADLHAGDTATLRNQIREQRSRADDAEARLHAFKAGRAVDGPIAEQLHRVHHHLRFCSWSLTKGGGEDFGERIGWVVHHVARLFTEMTGERCRACIKEIVLPEARGGTTGTLPITTVTYRTLRRTSDTHPPGTDPVPQLLVKSYCFSRLWLHSSTGPAAG
jgi:hypothetical protein